MSIIDSLITDRTQADVNRLLFFNSRGWDNLTDDERGEWLFGNSEQLNALDGPLSALDGELLAKSGTVKGAYNYNDLNRVEESTKYIAEELNSLLNELVATAQSYGVAWDADWLPDPAVGQQIYKTDWQAGEIPSASELDRYLSNVRACNTLALVHNLPTTMNELTFSAANAIEKLLVDLEHRCAELRAENEDRVDRISRGWFYSGDIYGGEI